MKRALVWIVGLVVIVSVIAYFWSEGVRHKDIKVGILHSLTGTMAASELPVVNGTLLAIEEINQKGGILGRKLVPVIADGHSDEKIFAEEAERLISEENVSVIFGCWTSASRKAVLPVLEKYNTLLFYPVQYEGLEESPYVFYTGATSNQQLIPAVKWCFDNLGKKFFLVGSDYIFPHCANKIMKYLINNLKGKVVGERYLLLGSKDVNDVVDDIIRAQPDVILNTINGDTNRYFFKELAKRKIFQEKMPVMSFSIGEVELKSFGLGQECVGSYACWNYFQSIKSPQNELFVKKYQARFGENAPISDPVEAGYFGVFLWTMAVEVVGSVDLKKVKKELFHQSYLAPEGLVHIDHANNHTWKTVRIGRLNDQQQFDILWSSNKPIRPHPFPQFLSKAEWLEYLDKLYTGWGNSWSNPKKTESYHEDQK